MKFRDTMPWIMRRILRNASSIIWARRELCIAENHALLPYESLILLESSSGLRLSQKRVEFLWKVLTIRLRNKSYPCELVIKCESYSQLRSRCVSSEKIHEILKATYHSRIVVSPPSMLCEAKIDIYYTACYTGTFLIRVNQYQAQESYHTTHT